MSKIITHTLFCNIFFSLSNERQAFQIRNFYFRCSPSRSSKQCAGSSEKSIASTVYWYKRKCYIGIWRITSQATSISSKTRLQVHLVEEIYRYLIFNQQPELRKVVKEQRSSPGAQYSSKTAHYNNGTSGNLSELDTLLQDLSSARYGANLQPRSGKSSLVPHNGLNESFQRPSVDDLLEELDGAYGGEPIYAVPNRYVLIRF